MDIFVYHHYQCASLVWIIELKSQIHWQNHNQNMWFNKLPIKRKQVFGVGGIYENKKTIYFFSTMKIVIFVFQLAAFNVIFFIW